MKRLLIVYYSHSGDVDRAVNSFTKCLNISEFEIHRECIKPKIDYPYPWSLYKFFDVFPECINNEAPEIYPPNFSEDDKFDLVILAYQVWFLSPSLPIQGFFKSKYAQVLQNTKVITLVVSRNMWHSASETMKKMIADVGGIHVDNVVVTHQGKPLATFISTPRLLLTGKTNGLWGVLPPGGVRDRTIDDLSRFGQQIANNLPALSDGCSDTYGGSQKPLLKGLDAVEVNPRYIIPELIGRIAYRPWAKIIRLFGKQGSWRRRPIIYIFAIQLIFAIPIVLLVSTIIQFLFAPLINKQIKSYVQLLKSPSSAVV
ncbi:hypothetical protein H6G54_06175 [Anabaena cylindrica FACHB-243]|uniref:Dialkylrecorsinol condensing enzyme n=1 Tax=Anabaena cylindrica (strain ATCC 27899 / PCC 7122) TaxID=272123 RepID=K9ZI86_ANACC|nr:MULTISPECIES: hypothetical protein [Anabaena]AFZ58479.1 hypothetical protein Anacy_3063 [Anabaena cylindrica PCC 7122]MBD2417300.1 hypothetical protein [Anabaena cylindrica FACHB-243]MBY5281421.1 hypothetical protein [Anabaena sp. CCAP 1446/1C]MBY5310188.1 hypothetical protein [Anabaena sp. CCAP 1446/1C]MCM2410137.1 hypothetical protein [Anabaena sp. CCAP 1446/1C]